MGFSSNTFIFLFLPAFLGVYYTGHFLSTRMRTYLTGIIIIVGSLIFYSWALRINAILLLVYTVFVWLMGCLINKTNSRYALFLCVISSLAILFYYKYNPQTETIAPIGISFITFSVISYFVDIYKGEESGSLSECMLYVLFFPKIVSGPIVLWRDFKPQAESRFSSVEGFVAGLNRMAIGLAKKIILADTFCSYAEKFGDQCIYTAWLGWIIYALQIYYDFSGYSDMAIGISKMIGFDIKENFNFPYRSLSITEFWRRWHISLGRFFREYVYIPLGGNRKGESRTLLNLAIVFALTGIWHGAGLSYIIWGTIHGIFVLVERIIKDKKWYSLAPGFIKWVTTFFVSASAWQFFRYGNNPMRAINSILLLFGIRIGNFDELSYFPWQYYLDSKIVFFVIVGLVGAILLGSDRIKSIYRKLVGNDVFYLFQEVAIMFILVISITYMVSSTYNPFVYFQF